MTTENQKSFSTRLIRTLSRMFHVGPNVFIGNPIASVERELLFGGKVKVVRLHYVKRSNNEFEHQALDLSGMQDILEAIKVCFDGDAFNLESRDLVISAFIFASQLFKATDAADVVLALSAFIQSTRSTTGGCASLIGEAYTKVFASAFEMQSLECPNMESLFDQLRGGLDFVTALRDVPIMKKLYTFLMYCLSSSLCEKVGVTFDTFGYSTFEAEAVKRAHTSKFGFAYSLLDTLSLFAKQAVRCYKASSLEPFFHTASSYERFVDMALALKRKEKCLSNPAPHGFDLFAYRAELADAIDCGETIVRGLGSVSDFERSKLKGLLGDLHILRGNDITRLSAQRDRPSPFGILLSGGSSLGKSTLITYLFQYYAALHKLSSESTSKYTRNGAEKHWNGFSTSQWCIVLDDVAAISDRLGTMDTSLQEIICIMNNVAFVPEQAALEDKGKTPVLSELVIASTNTPHLNAQSYFSCPLAVQRRLPWVVKIVVKEAFATNGMLDYTKCHVIDGVYQDWWDFEVCRVVPASESIKKQVGKLQSIKVFTSTGAFLQWFGRETLNHKIVQNSIGAQEKVTRNVAVCDQCLAPQYVPVRVGSCMCPHIMVPQSLEYTTAAVDLNETTTLATANFLRSVASPGLWTREDTWDLWYTFGVLLFTVSACYIHVILGPVSAWLIGYNNWATLSYCRIDWEGRFMRFVARRAGRAVNERYGNLITYAKIIATIAGSFALAHKLYNFTMPNIEHKFAPSPETISKLEEQVRVQVKLQELRAEHGEWELFLAQRRVEPARQALSAPLEEIGSRPTPVVQERVNVWYKNDFVVTSQDVTVQTACAKGIGESEFRRRLFSNCFRLDIVDNKEKGVSTGAIGVCGQIYAVNKHSLTGDQWAVTFARCDQSQGVNPNKTFLVVESQVYRVPNSDVAFVYVPGMPPCADITRYFATSTLNGRYIGEYLSINRNNYTMHINGVRNITRSTNPADDAEVMFGGQSEVLTVKGDCGALLWSFTPQGPVIFGIHSLGNLLQSVYASPLTLEAYSIAQQHFSVPQIQHGDITFTSDTAPEVRVGPLHYKSVFRFIEEGSAVVYGSKASGRSKPRSRVRPTLINSVAVTYGYEQKCSQPVMSGWEPWRIAALDMVDTPNSFRQDILEVCVEAFSNDILRNLTPEDLAGVMVYDLFTSVNGAAGVSFVDGVNRSTSAGFPWQTSKKKFLVPAAPIDGLNDPVDVTPEIKMRVERIIETYEQGVRTKPVFTAHLKDEPITFKKIAAKKTRVFGGAPFDWSLVVRMYFLSLVKLIQTKRFIFESAPGTIAQSGEWGDIYGYLTHFGLDQMVAGDYKAFDKSMPACMILAAFRILYNVSKAAGFTDEQIRVQWGVAVDTAFPVFDFNGDLVMLYGSNPSGHPLTVIINGLANALYMRYCYYVLNPSHECHSFKQNVHLMTYGDDNVMGVSKKCPWFNHTSIQGVLALHGVVYTMADKEAESLPYIHISQVSFLKRTWRWDNNVQSYTCPLEHDSIERSLMTCVESRSVSAEYQMMDIITSAMNEYFFYGEEEFHNREILLRQILTEANLNQHIDERTFPSYNALVERFQAYKIVSTWRNMV